MHGLNNNVIYKTLLCIERDKSSKIPRRKTTGPMYNDNQNEKVMRNTPPKNSTQDRFLVIPQTLNSHYRDLRRLNKHQISPNNHQTQQTKKEDWCTRLFKETKHMYTTCRGTSHVYMRLSNQKPCICFKKQG
jgi:hypothetical protein